MVKAGVSCISLLVLCCNCVSAWNHAVIAVIMTNTYSAPNLLVMLRVGYVGICSGLTGGHCSRSSSIVRPLLPLMSSDGRSCVRKCGGIMLLFGVGSLPLAMFFISVSVSFAFP
jgi:hypothetical protein